MQITGIASTSAAYAGSAGSAKSTGSASFADLLAQSETEAQAQKQSLAIMKQRIAAVGLAGYAREQQEIKRLMRVMTLVQGDASAEVKKALGEIIDDLGRDLPATPKDVYARIERYIANLSPDAAESVKDGLQGALARIKELAMKSDTALDELDALLRRRDQRLARA